MSGSTHESNARYAALRETDVQTCDQIRAELWGGDVSLSEISRRDDMPSQGTVRRHATGKCVCHGLEPAMRFDEDDGWQPVIGQQPTGANKSRVRITVEVDVPHAIGVLDDHAVDFARRGISETFDNVRLISGEVTR